VPRPVGAGVLTIIGGFFVLIGGAAFAVLGLFFAIFGVVSRLFLLGLLVGVLILLMGVLMVALPSAHSVWGFLTICLAVASIPFAFGGLIVGFVLTLFGGILAVRWRRPVDRIINAEARVIPPPSG